MTGSTTILNTLTGDISIPGYLEMDFIKDIRAEKKIAEGGEGDILFGSLINPELRKRYDYCADAIAIKKFNSSKAHEHETRFNHEIAVLSSLSSHPNVTTIVGFT